MITTQLVSALLVLVIIPFVALLIVVLTEAAADAEAEAVIDTSVVVDLVTIYCNTYFHFAVIWRGVTILAITSSHYNRHFVFIRLSSLIFLYSLFLFFARMW